MSDSIHARIGDCGLNSLSPEPCALIPESASLNQVQIVKAVEGSSAARLDLEIER